VAYTHRVKRVKVTVEKENPGEVTVLEAVAKPCEEFHLTEETRRRNPNRKTLCKLHYPLTDFAAFTYTDNPDSLGLSINKEWILLDVWGVKELYRTVKRWLWDYHQNHPEMWRKRKRNAEKRRKP